MVVIGCNVVEVICGRVDGVVEPTLVPAFAVVIEIFDAKVEVIDDCVVEELSNVVAFVVVEGSIFKT